MFGDMNKQLLFSVVIPHYNDMDGLMGCLNGLHKQDFPAEQYEILVVDDCSPLEIDHVVGDAYPKVRIVRQSTNMGPGAARNRGVEVAQGKFLAFIDSDACPGSSWLSSYAKELAKGRDIICGPVWHETTMLAHLTALTAFGEYMDDKDGWRRHCPSVNFVISASLMKQFSYDDTLGFAGEDVILSTQLTLAGYKIRYLASAWVWHRPNLSLRNFQRRAFLYGVGFRASRARCPDLAGYRLHYYLKASSAFPLFFIRVGLDLVRLWRLRTKLGLNAANFLFFAGGIFWTRLIYGLGVVWGYWSGLTR